MKTGNQNCKELRQYARKDRHRRSCPHKYLQTHYSFWLVMFYSCLYPHLFNYMAVVLILSSKSLTFDSFGIDMEKDMGMNLAIFSA